MPFPLALEGCTPREAIQDAVHRFLLGMDTNDRELFKSAFTADCTCKLFDNEFSGIDKLIENVFNLVGPMDTTHIMSSARIDYKAGADHASMISSIMAQHGPPGTGLDASAPRFLAGVLYHIDFVKDSTDWKIKVWKITMLWTQGDESVMNRRTEAS